MNRKAKALQALSSSVFLKEAMFRGYYFQQIHDTPVSRSAC